MAACGPAMTRYVTFAPALLLSVLPVPAAAFFHSGSSDAKAGRALYAQHCAACHGTNLEGQPDWRSPDESGLYPAPPHDETGHTWHHDDAMLTDYITRGGQAVLNDMGVAFTSGMPGCPGGTQRGFFLASPGGHALESAKAAPAVITGAKAIRATASRLVD